MVSIRPTTGRGLDKFYHLVRDVDFSNIFDEQISLGEATDRFVSTVSELAREAFPIRVVRCGRNNPLKIVWYTPELRRMRERLRFFSDLFQTTRSECVGTYCPQGAPCFV